MSNITQDRAEELLRALGEQLATNGESYELVVVGGSALLALGLVERTTKDVDIVALRSDAGLGSADPLPQGLRDASGLVARDFGLPADWLNSGPAGLLTFGLPEGFVDRLERREYGPGLVVYLASRSGADRRRPVESHPRPLRGLPPDPSRSPQIVRSH